MANGFKINEDDGMLQKKRPAVKKSGFAAFLIRQGLAKTETQANLYLIGVVLICFGIIFYQNFG